MYVIDLPVLSKVMVKDLAFSPYPFFDCGLWLATGGGAATGVVDCEAAVCCAGAEDPVGVVGGGTEVIRFIGFFLIRARIGLPCGSKKKGLSKVAIQITRSSDGDDRRRRLSGFAETVSLIFLNS